MELAEAGLMLTLWSLSVSCTLLIKTRSDLLESSLKSKGRCGYWTAEAKNEFLRIKTIEPSEIASKLANTKYFSSHKQL